MENKIPTDKGKLTVPEIMNLLSYSSYKANRGYGMSHEQLLKIGIGDDQMKAAYEAENLPTIMPLTLGSDTLKLIEFVSHMQKVTDQWANETVGTPKGLMANPTAHSTTYNKNNK